MSERRGEWPIKLNKLGDIPNDAALRLRMLEMIDQHRGFSSVRGFLGGMITEQNLIDNNEEYKRIYNQVQNPIVAGLPRPILRFLAAFRDQYFQG